MPEILSLADWRKDTVLRDKLNGILNDPTLKAAIRSLREFNTPSIPTGLLSNNTLSPDEIAGMGFRHAHAAGFHGFATALQQLATSSVRDEPIRPEPWAHIQDRPLKRQPISKK